MNQWVKTALYSMVVLYSRDRYEIIGLHKISHSIKQPKALEMHQKCLNNAVPFVKQNENQLF